MNKILKLHKIEQLPNVRNIVQQKNGTYKTMEEGNQTVLHQNMYLQVSMRKSILILLLSKTKAGEIDGFMYAEHGMAVTI